MNNYHDEPITYIIDLQAKSNFDYDACGCQSCQEFYSLVQEAKGLIFSGHKPYDDEVADKVDKIIWYAYGYDFESHSPIPVTVMAERMGAKVKAVEGGFVFESTPSVVLKEKAIINVLIANYS